MTTITMKNEALLSNAKVQEEISRHRWIESEKAGTDIGFDRAAQDWLNRYSDEWMKYHLPQQNIVGRTAPKGGTNSAKTSRSKFLL